MNVYVAYLFMMRRRMVFCEIIRQILKTWAPVNFKLALFHPIFDPINAHVHSFGKRESVRPSKHCRYDVPTARKFHPTFDDEKDENEEYH
jgi:hypothetical protein